MAFIITGHARSGTTCVARIVEELGVHLFYDRERNREDYFLSDLIEQSKWQKVRDEVARRNVEVEQWAFKRPFVVPKLELHWHLFIPCKFLVVLRDPVAIANSIERHDKRPANKRMTRNRQIDATMSFMAEQHAILKRVTSPVMFVSYERILRYPVEEVANIASFLDVAPTSAAVDAIRPQDVSYQDDRAIGR